jgi:parvulin-like peptidyl-prolyl isomerase
MLRNRILIGVGLVLVAAIALVVFAFIQDRVIAPSEPIATVNGEEIPAWVFEGRVRSAQVNLLNQLQSLSQTYQTLEEDSDLRSFYQEQIDSLSNQLADPLMVGSNTLDSLLDEYLVRQEAKRRGITVSEEDVDRTVAELFGFYPDGTPTSAPPGPTPTVDVDAPTTEPTLEVTPSLTPAVSPTPFLTATPYTLEAYEEQYAAYLERLRGVELEERDFLLQIEMGLYRERLLKEFESEVSRLQEQVRARHILAEEEDTALEVLDFLAEGEAWEDLAAEYSQDESNKDAGGELGWFGPGQMVEVFEQAAFGAEVGEIVGPVETSFGWHIIEILDRGERELTDGYYRQAVAQALSDWLTNRREEAEIEFVDGWTEKIPLPPL